MPPSHASRTSGIAGLSFANFGGVEKRGKRAPQALQSGTRMLVLKCAKGLQIAIAGGFAVAVHQAAIRFYLGRRIGEIDVPIARDMHLVNVSADLTDQRQVEIIQAAIARRMQ